MPSILTRLMAIAIFSFAIAACAQPPGAPAKTAASPDTTSEAATAPSVSPAKEAYVMSDAPTAAPERGPAIPAAQLRERILALIGSFQSLKDLEKENVEHTFGVRLTKMQGMSDGHEYDGMTQEGWKYGISTAKLGRLDEPSTLIIGMDYGFDYDNSQPPNYCTLEFEQLAKELVAMGYERAGAISRLKGQKWWNFVKKSEQTHTSLDAMVYLYEMPDENGVRYCIKSFNIGGERIP